MVPWAEGDSGPIRETSDQEAGAKMMRCRDIPDVASRFLDREAGAVERLQVRLHLVICRHCRAYVNGIAAVGPLVAESLRRSTAARPEGEGRS